MPRTFMDAKVFVIPIPKENVMNRIRGLVLLAIIVCCVLPYAAIGQTKIVEKEGGFSFTAPKGWTVRTMSGLKYKIAVGPITSSFAVNINVVDEKFKGTVEQYSKGNQATLTKILPGYKKVSESPFQTALKLKGIKLVFTSKPQGKPLGQTAYCFRGKNETMFVVTCTSMLDVAPKYSKTFDETMKTFALL